MNRPRYSAWLTSVVLLCIAPLQPTTLVLDTESATLTLSNGATLRGDCALAADGIVLENALGRKTFPWDRLTNITWLDDDNSIGGQHRRRFVAIARDDVAAHFALAEWLQSQADASRLLRTQLEYVLRLAPDHEAAQAMLAQLGRAPDPPAVRVPADAGAASRLLAAPALLSEADINYLKLAEYPRTGAAERVVVAFPRDANGQSAVDLAMAEIRESPTLDPAALDVLTNGAPHEKLQVILYATGMKYADRIVVRSQPAVFAEFRRRVLPRVMQSCGRSGCHSGGDAGYFRLPEGARSTDGFVYGSLLVLDRVNTKDGAVIDRQVPRESLLVRYLLPESQGGLAHPQVPNGRVMPAFESRNDPRYRAIVDWIASLRSPAPDYELEWEQPDWLAELAAMRPDPLFGTPPAPPLATQPASDRVGGLERP